MGEVLLPPWILPETPETIRWLDDAGITFPPAFGRGMTQRGSWGDPRWGLRRRYRGMRLEERAVLIPCLNESRGQFNKYLITPHAPLRGSFPSTELMTNPTFASGTTGFTAYSPTSAISVTDRAMRLSRVLVNGTNGSGFYNTSGISLTQYLPYVARGFVRQGRANAVVSPALVVGTTAGSTTAGGSTALTGYGMVSLAFVPPATASYFVFFGDGVATGVFAGDFLLWPFVSLTQCMLVDNQSNLLRQSNDFDASPWALTNATVSASGGMGPDGSTNGQNLRETTTNGQHYTAQDVTVPAAAADYSFSVYAQSNTRDWIYLRLIESTGSTAAIVFFNTSTGAIGTITTGANWSNIRGYISSMGNGFYRCTMVARKTSAATTLSAYIGGGSADNTLSYAGTGTNTTHVIWEATLAQSSLPVRHNPTTSTAIAATAQSGGGLFVKGLPVSTNGILEANDWVEVAGQLKQVTARLNSDASGLGFLQFRPSLADAPADNDPVIVNQPFGRFIYSGQQKEMENLFGLYADIEMNLEEVYS